MMRPDRNMPGRLRELLRDAKGASPIERFHTSVGKAVRPGKILAAGHARNLESGRMPKYFFLRALSRDAPVLQHNELFAYAVRLFEIMAHEQGRSAVAC